MFPPLNQESDTFFIPAMREYFRQMQVTGCDLVWSNGVGKQSGDETEPKPASGQLLLHDFTRPVTIVSLSGSPSTQ